MGKNYRFNFVFRMSLYCSPTFISEFYQRVFCDIFVIIDICFHMAKKCPFGVVKKLLLRWWCKGYMDRQMTQPLLWIRISELIALADLDPE